MKQKFETEVMEQLKKGYSPVYAGEEGYVMITMNGYMAAAEYAGAERSHFWYGGVEFLLIDVEAREDEIEAEEFDFMPAKIEEDFEEISPEEIESPDLEDAEAMYRLINDRLRLLAARLYEMRCDRLLQPEATKIEDNIQDIVTEMERHEKMLSRIMAYIRAKNLEVKKE